MTRNRSEVSVVSLWKIAMNTISAASSVVINKDSPSSSTTQATSSSPTRRYRRLRRDCHGPWDRTGFLGWQPSTLSACTIFESDGDWSRKITQRFD
jgi:hypothetical protein